MDKWNYEKMPTDQPSHQKTTPIWATITENSQMTATHITKQIAIIQGRRRMLTPGFRPYRNMKPCAVA